VKKPIELEKVSYIPETVFDKILSKVFVRNKWKRDGETKGKKTSKKPKERIKPDKKPRDVSMAFYKLWLSKNNPGKIYLDELTTFYDPTIEKLARADAILSRRKKVFENMKRATKIIDEYNEQGLWKENDYKISIFNDGGNLEGETKSFGNPMTGYYLEIYAVKEDLLGSRCNIPFGSLGKEFLGRNNELITLEELLDKEDLGVNVSGFPGAGKTQFVAEYAINSKTQYPGGTFWVNADSRDGKFDIQNSFCSLLFPMGIVGLDRATMEFKEQRVLEWLRMEPEKCLIIFDDVCDWNEVERWIRQLKHHHILITSRNPKLSLSLTNYHLDVLQHDMAIDCFLMKLDGTVKQNKAITDKELTFVEQIVKRLGGLPLAIELASLYIKNCEGTVTFKGYDKRLEEEGLTKTIDDAVESNTASRHIASITATLNPIWNSITIDQEKSLMKTMAFTGSDAISPDIISAICNLPKIAPQPGHPNPLDKVSSGLMKRGLLKKTTSQRLLSHVVIKDYIIGKLEKEEKVFICNTFANSLYTFLKNKELADPEQIEKLEPELPHFMEIFRWVEKLRIEGQWSEFYSYFGMYLLGRCYIEEAEQIIERSLEIRSRYAIQHEICEVLDLMNLVGVYKSRGDFKKASTYLRKWGEIIIKKMDEERLEKYDYISYRLMCVEIFFPNGDFDFLNELLESVEKYIDKNQQKDRAFLSQIYGFKAKIKWYQGKADEGVNLTELGLELLEGDNSPQVNVIYFHHYFNLAGLKFFTSEIGEAIEYGKKAKALANRLFVSGNPYSQQLDKLVSSLEQSE